MKTVNAERMDHDAYHCLEDMFAEGYREACNKMVYLRLAHIPFEIPAGPESVSDAMMHLKEVRIEEVFMVGSVTPAFGSDQLIHQMYPHKMVGSHKSLKFIYVHVDGLVEKSLHELFGLVIEDADHHG